MSLDSIERFIQQGDINAACKALVELSTSLEGSNKMTASILSATWNQLEDDGLRGELSPDEQNRQERKLMFDILTLVGKIKSSGPTAPPAENKPTESNTSTPPLSNSQPNIIINIDNKNENHVDITNTIDVNIQISINGLTSSVEELTQEVRELEDVPEEVWGEIEEVKEGIKAINEAETKEDLQKGGWLNKIRRFIDNSRDETTPLGKTVRDIKSGVSIAQDIAKQYNAVAEWLMLPQVPSIFLKKTE